jgi:hypothetical protein
LGQRAIQLWWGIVNPSGTPKIAFCVEAVNMAKSIPAARPVNPHRDGWSGQPLAGKAALKVSLILIISACATSRASGADTAREPVIKIVSQIQRADYEGDRPALNDLYEQLTPFVDEPEVSSRVRYWRGFAKWRRGINGFNETPTPKDLAEDLTEGESEFDAAIQRDPAFVDAKVGAVSCMGLRLFLEKVFSKEKDPARLKEILAPVSQMMKEAKAEAPGNPRLLWVVGPNEWNIPPERGGGQDKAIATYQQGLETIRKQKGATTDPLEPSWGEPELLMSLAWSNLNRTTPDLNAAEQYAKAALEIVPYWHYARDILLRQIQDAKAKSALNSPGPR